MCLICCKDSIIQNRKENGDIVNVYLDIIICLVVLLFTIVCLLFYLTIEDMKVNEVYGNKVVCTMPDYPGVVCELHYEDNGEGPEVSLINCSDGRTHPFDRVICETVKVKVE